MIEEKIVLGEGTEYPLNGLLTLPADASAPVPAVVFVHGSGSADMNSKVGKLTPFKDLAEGLAKHGIASLRFAMTNALSRMGLRCCATSRW